MRILNLTQHVATPEQIAAGVIEPSADIKAKIVDLLTFDKIPLGYEMTNRATDLAALAASYLNETAVSDKEKASPLRVMIGGAPFFMSSLEERLDAFYIEALYAFSARESVDEVQEDGSVLKKSVFKHKGFVLV